MCELFISCACFHMQSMQIICNLFHSFFWSPFYYPLQILLRITPGWPSSEQAFTCNSTKPRQQNQLQNTQLGQPDIDHRIHETLRVKRRSMTVFFLFSVSVQLVFAIELLEKKTKVVSKNDRKTWSETDDIFMTIWLSLDHSWKIKCVIAQNNQLKGFFIKSSCRAWYNEGNYLLNGK